MSHPVVAQHRGVLIKSEADNLMARFDHPNDAVSCALAIQRAHADRNSALTEDERFTLSIGIDHGSYLVLEDDAFGDAVNIAYKVGEDLASAEEILLTDRLVNVLGGPETRPGGLMLADAGSHEAGQVPVKLYRLEWNGKPQ